MTQLPKAFILITCAAMAGAPMSRAATSTAPTSTRTFYLTAGELGSKLDQAEGFGRSTGHDSVLEGHEGMMFVAGVADVIQGSLACPTPRERESLVTTKAADFIRSHPARANESAAQVVADALKTHFPCPAP